MRSTSNYGEKRKGMLVSDQKKMQVVARIKSQSCLGHDCVVRSQQIYFAQMKCTLAHITKYRVLYPANIDFFHRIATQKRQRLVKDKPQPDREENSKIQIIAAQHARPRMPG
jgi:hypothetical protein